MNKKILIILGHTDKDTFSGSLVKSYAKGAKKADYEVKILYLGDIEFDPILYKGYKEIQELEPDLKKAKADILWADHLVWVFPTWWGCFPAILKGFIDRVILPGFGFKYHKNNPLWDRLLKGKSARIITTMDSPKILYNLGVCSAGVKIIKNATLRFCGVSPVRVTKITMLKKANEKKRKKILKKVEKIGFRGR